MSQNEVQATFSIKGPEENSGENQGQGDGDGMGAQSLVLTIMQVISEHFDLQGKENDLQAKVANVVVEFIQSMSADHEKKEAKINELREMSELHTDAILMSQYTQDQQGLTLAHIGTDMTRFKEYVVDQLTQLKRRVDASTPQPFECQGIQDQSTRSDVIHAKVEGGIIVVWDRELQEFRPCRKCQQMIRPGPCGGHKELWQAFLKGQSTSQEY